MQILVVEDKVSLADFIQRSLETEGYGVVCVNDGVSAEREALTGDYDLVLLDVVLPGKSGLEVLRAVRVKLPDLPVLMLTARGELEDRVEGLDLGANDYMVKPFPLAELLARVRAHLRVPARREADSVEAGGVTLSISERRAFFAGRTVQLTAREFALLELFMRRPGETLDRATILKGVWGYDHDPGTNVIEVYVRYLRSKLYDEEGNSPIETVRSVGYRLAV